MGARAKAPKRPLRAMQAQLFDLAREIGSPPSIADMLRDLKTIRERLGVESLANLKDILMSQDENTPSTPAWSHERFVFACRLRGINSPIELARHMTEYRAKLDPPQPAMPRTTAARYWNDERCPTISRPGEDAAFIGLADALGVSLDWLMGRTPFASAFTMDGGRHVG